MQGFVLKASGKLYAATATAVTDGYYSSHCESDCISHTPGTCVAFAFKSGGSGSTDRCYLYTSDLDLTTTTSNALWDIYEITCDPLTGFVFP